MTAEADHLGARGRLDDTVAVRGVFEHSEVATRQRGVLTVTAVARGVPRGTPHKPHNGAGRLGPMNQMTRRTLEAAGGGSHRYRVARHPRLIDEVVENI
jgi:hypothetical protein